MCGVYKVKITMPETKRESTGFELTKQRYGKNNVKFLRVVRDGPKHEVKELRVRILLEGAFEISYTQGDNSTIVATDTQKNTLFALAKLHPIEPLEQWCLQVANDFLARHKHISAVNLKVEEHPWDRIRVSGKEHDHAFEKGSGGIRIVKLRMPRNGTPSLSAGFRDLEILKTTQSGFEGFIRDEYTTLPETRDRVFATKMKCEYTFNRFSRTAFSSIQEKVKEIALSTFAGNIEGGTYSPSVQQTLYQTAQKVLNTIPEVETISFSLPNVHYYLCDFKNFKTNVPNNNEVFHTYDGPSGLIEATVSRNSASHLGRAKM
ncbi:uricase-like [Planoprotostelium fungivorum]|uniref:Uricase n=1 Tax=Planoprotostelium fungivorum TaxID=1890364 RepID=A0A2P6NDJ8_9EUKA|nr:uricase-like [Planoprotostelium fungivorum]